jgi:major type 1 subunit fimbrin (pilin)
MKHIKLASAAAIALGLAIAGSASAQTSAGGTITFTGSVADATCTVSGGAGTNGGTGNFIVALDQVTPGDFAAAGATAGPKPFSVQIGAPGQTSCVNGSIGTMSFLTSSPQIDAANGNLKNALTGEATNTEIQLLDGTTQAPINLASGSYSVASPAVANNTATIPFVAQYYADGGIPTAGLVSTSVVYKVVFN